MNYPVHILKAGLAVWLCLAAAFCHAQYPRLHDHNVIGWLVYEGDHAISSRWAVHTEAQWRQTVSRRQQDLLRLGLSRKLSDRIELSGGYTHFRSHAYGSYPEVPGRAEPEHRIYEDIKLKDELAPVTLTHRLRLEQRWLGSRDASGQGPVQAWAFQNRIRYQLSAELPLQGSSVDDHEWYLNAFDEVFIGFGKNVKDNVFNQNRLSAGLGYQLNDQAKLELNYIYQLRQHAEPDASTQRQVLEINQGVRVTIVWQMDFTK
ncbi:DUF2490 domain-containing protein [Dyadobacter sandarakinus]|uniref:DUF2490 domain-containing protein n=1 Tax=Dyadobacter sandarakinus TaxID=2747268 RepID=A0ABX7I3I4_9BACT|nr:DUF2490 domain-containing protein [Dyadobacter sandarakinus]QRR00634.1 DUF2490 domain-containing protein [Dyadobacter sandarakinus]